MSGALLDGLRALLADVDSDGRVRPGDAAAVRAAVSGLRAEGHAFDHPRELFGEWDHLSDGARATLTGMAESEIARAMSWHARGPLWPDLARILRTLRAPALGLDAAAADLWSARLWRVPGRLRARAYAVARRRAFARDASPGLADVLQALGRSPSWLLGDFVRGVREDPRARGYYQDTETGSTWGYLVGVDMIPTPEGVVCVEANLNTAFNDERRAEMSPDPSIRAALGLAESIGARGLWWDDMDLSATPEWVLRELAAGARAAGLTLTVREDVRSWRDRPLPRGLPTPRRRVTAPAAPPPGTLVVRRNEFGVGSDRVLSDKGLFSRAVSAELERAGDRRVHVPAMTRVPVVRPADGEGLPNLVYKYPDGGKGTGVFFLNARDVSHAVSLARALDREHGEPPGLFQEFRCSRLLPGRRIYDARAELLVTPRGVVHCFTIRRESMRALPEAIGEGVLDVKGAFTSNLATGGRFAPIDRAEEEELRQAALAVGEGLARAFERTFVTRG